MEHESDREVRAEERPVAATPTSVSPGSTFGELDALLRERFSPSVDHQ
ncbi:MAG: hypothetical protein R3A48_03630 [Polyangiales bacterium]